MKTQHEARRIIVDWEAIGVYKEMAELCSKANEQAPRLAGGNWHVRYVLN